jgi:hypothetical protein
VGRVAFKKEGDPLGWQTCLHTPLMHCALPPSEPPDGGVRVAFVLLSLEERNFPEVGTFQPSLDFKDFHQAARLHPLADGHPRR